MQEQVIICVDDEDFVVKSLKRELKQAFNEYLIETADSGKEALELVEELLVNQYEIPVIISDHIMPDMKGDELLQRIHAMSPKTLKIMLTGQADMDAVTNAVNFANLYHYIAKPWETPHLILTIKQAIHQYTQDKKIEEQNRILQTMNATLEQQVRERTAELENANASKDKFFSILAHDLRAPFNGLLSMTELFAESMELFSQEELREGLQALRKNSKTVYELLENLLTWSRLQRGVIEYFPKEMLLARVTEHAIHLLSPIAEQKQITLTAQVPKSTLVYADSNMIDTVVRNLTSNALKFTGSGGAVDITVTSGNDAVTVAVSDTGKGMEQEDVAKLFRIDVKYTCVGTAGEKGSGLGLILCQELVEQNGGKIWVESEPDKGTTFFFTIPTLEF